VPFFDHLWDRTNNECERQDMTKSASVSEVLLTHRDAGRFFRASGVGSFVRDEGEGDPIVMIHGLPASSFLYRRMLPEIAAKGFRAIAFDLPGMGLAERPRDFDYTIGSLSEWCVAAVDDLGLDRFHLVVHDAGGPVGFGLAARINSRIKSLTIFDTVIEVGRIPFPGELLARFAGEMRGPFVSKLAWRALMYRVGIQDRSATSHAEVDAYRLLALGPDGGWGYLQIMSHLREIDETSRYRSVVDSRTAKYPIALAWGAYDPALSLGGRGAAMLRATGLPSMTVLPAKHFPQEDQAPALSKIVVDNAGRAR
jgi:haloalkane dehalogenase